MPITRAQWINLIAIVLGGVALGFGIVRLTGGWTAAGAFWSIVGVILLWWAYIDRRKLVGGTPESEEGGSHTVE